MVAFKTDFEYQSHLYKTHNHDNRDKLVMKTRPKNENKKLKDREGVNMTEQVFFSILEGYSS
jgi:uncharacterized C2H2 Zn-finger protein